VVAIACGDVRGVGNDAYIAYVLGPAPPLGQAVCTHYCSRLAVLRPGEAHLVNIDELPGFELPSRTGGGFPPSLQIRDVTGDGRGEIIFQGATWRGTMYGGYADDVAVWTWNREAAYQRVFDASGIHFRVRVHDSVYALESAEMRQE
jgi:hypothetical protein